uniref:Uncharacterized protein n=1 Tax=Lygus hesperus TaxID=30085 RepID=A0A146LJT7_LYGHE
MHLRSQILAQFDTKIEKEAIVRRKCERVEIYRRLEKALGPRYVSVLRLPLPKSLQHFYHGSLPCTPSGGRARMGVWYAIIDTEAFNPTPTCIVLGSTPLKMVATTTGHNLAVDAQNCIYTWGRNNLNVDVVRTNQLTPIYELSHEGAVASVVGGASISIILFESGKVYAVDPANLLATSPAALTATTASARVSRQTPSEVFAAPTPPSLPLSASPSPCPSPTLSPPHTPSLSSSTSPPPLVLLSSQKVVTPMAKQLSLPRSRYIGGNCNSFFA